MVILKFCLFAGLVTLGLGVAGFSLISEGQLGPEYQRVLVTIERIDWPHVTFRAGEQTWTIDRWTPLPWWTVGQQVGIWVRPDSARVVPEFGPYHPLLLILYGFLTVMISSTWMVGFLPRTSAREEAAIQQVLLWPIELRENVMYAWVLIAMAIGLTGWVIYDWMVPTEGAPPFDAAADLGRLALAIVMIVGGTYWLSRKITVTPDEIADVSILGSRTIRMSSIKKARYEDIRSKDSKRKLLGHELVLYDERGEKLMTLSRGLEPTDTCTAFFAYLLKRFPD